MNKEQLARELGISKTVYSLVYRETEAIEAQCRAEMPRDLYGQPWTGKQDALHEDFFKAWANIIGKSVTGFGFEKMRTFFPHYYPTNGSSEAIRDVISHISADHSSDEYILVFEGEYEGYKAYASAYGIRIVEIPRENYNLEEITRKEGRRPNLFISQPSSIDGNVWSGLESLLEEVDRLNEKWADVNIKVHLDLCYVGCTNGVEYNVNLIHPCIETVFFSLSKVYGVYYHRIGGVWSRNKIHSLWGNKWFKNLFSLYFGTRLIHEIGCDFAAKYAALQARAVRSLSDRPDFEGIIIEPSDVFIIANSPIGKFSNEIQQEFRRANNARFCLTPGLSSVLTIKEQALDTDPFGVSR